MSELLCEQRSLVNDLSDYGSELSALTGCQQISAEAEELSHWHECLRQNAWHKATEITAALQQANAQVSVIIIIIIIVIYSFYWFLKCNHTSYGLVEVFV